MQLKCMKKNILQFLVVIIIVLGGFLIIRPIEKKQSLPSGGDFTLESNQGKISLSQFKNKLIILYFGYTYCPDVCPMGLGYLTQALNLLSTEEKKQIQILFITLDPERDDATTLDKYLNFFHKDILGLHGSADEIQKIAQRYNVQFKKHFETSDQSKYSIDHSSYVYIINKDGILSELLPHTLSGESFVKEFRKYL